MPRGKNGCPGQVHAEPVMWPSPDAWFGVFVDQKGGENRTHYRFPPVMPWVALSPHIDGHSGGWPPGWKPSSPACGSPPVFTRCIGQEVKMAFKGHLLPQSLHGKNLKLPASIVTSNTSPSGAVHRYSCLASDNLERVLGRLPRSFEWSPTECLLNSPPTLRVDLPRRSAEILSGIHAVHVFQTAKVFQDCLDYLGLEPFSNIRFKLCPHNPAQFVRRSPTAYSISAGVIGLAIRLPDNLFEPVCVPVILSRSARTCFVNANIFHC